MLSRSGAPARTERATSLRSAASLSEVSADRCRRRPSSSMAAVSRLTACRVALALISGPSGGFKITSIAPVQRHTPLYQMHTVSVCDVLYREGRACVSLKLRMQLS